MKFSSLCALAFFLTCTLSKAQITIRTADLPSAGDTFRVSIANNLPGADYTLTGPNYTWDFSSLTAQSQRVDTFLSVASTSAVFNVVFTDLFFNPYRSNIATGGADFTLGTVAVNDVYNFYYNSAASYAQTGFGATISGIPAPFAYSQKDLVYEFPLQFGDLDTSLASYDVDLSSIIGLYFRVNRTRVNQVDGWGTLITPYGTHQVIRVKTTVTERDSVHIDSLGFGLNLPAVTNLEYKWLATGEGVPLLQANASGNGTVNQVLYREDAVVNTAVIAPVRTDQLEVYPNPASDRVFIRTVGSFGNATVSLIDLHGRIVLEKDVEMNSQDPAELLLDRSMIPAGNYLLRLKSEEGTSVRQITLK